MIRRLRAAFGGKTNDGTSRRATDAAVGRGMADVLAALDNVIDDETALVRLYAAFGTNVPGSAITTARASAPVASGWRLAPRTAVAVAAALAAGAVALAAIGIPGAGQDGTEGPAVDTAYVVQRIDSALTAAGPDEIAHMMVTFSVMMLGGRTATATAEEWSYGDQWRAVATSVAGHLVYDEGSSASSLYTLVSYPTRTWARQPGRGRPAAPGSCGSVVTVLPSLFPPWLPGSTSAAGWLPATAAGVLRTAVSCGTLSEDGWQRVDGIEAIKLTSRPGSLVSETIWVSAGTYLPVRVFIRSASGAPVPRETADITWLSPTVQNLARLAVPVPAGFRQVPLAEAVGQASQQNLGGQPTGVSNAGPGEARALPPSPAPAATRHSPGRTGHKAPP
jgi:hypothetical protein